MTVDRAAGHAIGGRARDWRTPPRHAVRRQRVFLFSFLQFFFLPVSLVFGEYFADTYLFVLEIIAIFGAIIAVRSR